MEQYKYLQYLLMASKLRVALGLRLGVGEIYSLTYVITEILAFRYLSIEILCLAVCHDVSV